MSKRKHIVPGWTYWATPCALAAMILIPWPAYAKAEPESASLILALLGVGMAIVVISLTHWIKKLTG